MPRQLAKVLVAAAMELVIVCKMLSNLRNLNFNGQFIFCAAAESDGVCDARHDSSPSGEILGPRDEGTSARFIFD